MKKIDTEGLGETAIWFVVKSLKVNQVNKVHQRIISILFN